MIYDELVHVIKQIVRQAIIEQRSVVYAHLAAYDPNTHTARVIVPSMRDDQTGDPLFSGWLPMGSMQVGGKYGIQVVPLGGATPQNPTAGELCLVSLNERGTGVAAITSLFYTGAQQPPNTSLQQGSQLNPGEIIILHQTGAVIRMHSTGAIDVATGKDGALTLSTSGKGGVSVNTTGDGPISLTASGSGAISIANSGSAGVDISVSNAAVTIESSQKMTVTAPEVHVAGVITASGSITANTPA